MNIRTLIIVLLLALAGCASKEPEPPVVVPENTWRWVDWDIIAASQLASETAQIQAHQSMEHWKDLVYRRTETDFIPWYSGYWTQQWLGMKVAWYDVSAGDEKDATVNRLAHYLEDEYQDQVLDPVAKQTSPDLIREQATSLYVARLGKELAQIPQRYSVPQEQFDQRLQSIPAIALTPPAERNASLYQLLHARSLKKLPAYGALTGKIEASIQTAEAKPSDVGITGLARRTSEKLEAQIATRGVASTVSTVVGKVASAVLSVGATAYGVIAHQLEKPEMEAQLRTTMNQAFDEDWQELMRNRETGVLAGVYYLSGTIEADRNKAVAQSLQSAQPEPGIALPEEHKLESQDVIEVPVDYLQQFLIQSE